jgi:hypothetical protein
MCPKYIPLPLEDLWLSGYIWPAELGHQRADRGIWGFFCWRVVAVHIGTYLHAFDAIVAWSLIFGNGENRKVPPSLRGFRLVLEAYDSPLRIRRVNRKIIRLTASRQVVAWHDNATIEVNESG